MTHEPSDDDIDLDAPLTVTDYVEMTCDILEEAVDQLKQGEIELLCADIRAKISAILREHRMWRPDDTPGSEDDRDPGNRWWDRP